MINESVRCLGIPAGTRALVRYALTTAILFLTVVSTDHATASQGHYQCKIMQYFDLAVNVGLNYSQSSAGPMFQGDPRGVAPAKTSEWVANEHSKVVIGKEFTVSTTTGLMQGSDPPENDQAKQYILNPGGTGQSFVGLSVWGPVVATQYFELKEFDLNPEKPFILVRDGNVYTGLCIQ